MTRLPRHTLRRYFFSMPVACLAALLCGCSGDKAEVQADTSRSKAVISETLRPRQPRSNYLSERYADEMPDGGEKLHLNGVGGTLGKVFNDSNHVQLVAARSIGISPIHTTADAWRTLVGMKKVESCHNYFVDNLSHSLPYLVPEAATLLDDIGANFNRKLRERGGGNYRLKVTSLLRTPATVKQLRRRNRNATTTSAHLFGTTFDISYADFIWDGGGKIRTQEDLKNLLGEVLKELRDAGRCYVKYERKQACFHITARP